MHWRSLAIGLGLGIGVPLLAGTVAGGVTTPTTIALATVAAIFVLIGLWALGSVYLGWRWPKTYEEKKAERERREQEARSAYYAWRDALQELLDELWSNRRSLGLDLANDRVYGAQYPGTAWEKNRHVLRDHPEARRLVQEAYLQTHTLNLRVQERYDAASQDELNDQAWHKLTADERHEREAALDSVIQAHTAVAGVATQEAQP